MKSFKQLVCMGIAAVFCCILCNSCSTTSHGCYDFGYEATHPYNPSDQTISKKLPNPKFNDHENATH